MDDIVKQAMAKWPNVPACSGWLGLDARGQWWLRDDQAQACGAFTSGKPGAKGNALRHEKLAEFIGRNYLAESDGRWKLARLRAYWELPAMMRQFLGNGIAAVPAGADDEAPDTGNEQ